MGLLGGAAPLPPSLTWGRVGGHVGWGHGVMLEVMLGSCWDHVGCHVGCHVGVMLDVMLGSCWEVVFLVFEGCLAKKTTGPEG